MKEASRHAPLSLVHQAGGAFPWGEPAKSVVSRSRMFLFQGCPHRPFSLVHEPPGPKGGGVPDAEPGALCLRILPSPIAGRRFPLRDSHFAVYRGAEGSLGPPVHGRRSLTPCGAAGHSGRRTFPWGARRSPHIALRAMRLRGAAGFDPVAGRGTHNSTRVGKHVNNFF